jgi:hypothetical protein
MHSCHEGRPSGELTLNFYHDRLRLMFDAGRLASMAL